MSTTSRLPYGRLFAELFVIVLGVMVALAGDRWVSALDERDREVSYLQQLVSNLEADSVVLEVVVDTAEARHRFAVSILERRVDTTLSPDRLRCPPKTGPVNMALLEANEEVRCDGVGSRSRRLSGF
jgi:hypothetical protein